MAERQKAAEQQDAAAEATADAPPAATHHHTSASGGGKRIRVAWPWTSFTTPDGMSDLTREWSKEPLAPDTIAKYQAAAEAAGVRLEVEQL